MQCIAVTSGSLYGQAPSEWPVHGNHTIACFSVEDTAGYLAEAERVCQNIASGRCCFFIPFEATLELPCTLSLAEYAKYHPNGYIEPGLYCGPEFGNNIELVDAQILTAVLACMPLQAIPPNYVFPTLLAAIEKNAFPEIVGCAPRDEAITWLRSFATYAASYTPAEVDQVVWQYLMSTTWGFHEGEDVDQDFWLRYLNSMVFPFTGYLSKLDPDTACELTGFLSGSTYVPTILSFANFPMS